MSQKALNLFCAVMVGIIVFIADYLLNKARISFSMEKTAICGLISAIACYVVLIPAVLNRIKHLCCDYDWAEETVKFYQGIQKKYRQSFWILFGFINLAFLFHTMHFMWGNKDWAAVRFVVDSTESINNGDFSLYWLQDLIFDGKILPVINNLWSFAGLSLSAVLLAVYWDLPRRATPIIITGLLFSLTPYTLAILYHARITLGFCWLPAIVLTALLLAEQKGQTHIHTYIYNLVSVFLFLWALGSYMPVINFIAIAILGQIFLKTVYADISFCNAAKRTCQSVANFSAAMMIYIFTLYILKETGRLTESALSFSTPLLRIPLWLQYSFLQFAEPLPFMDIVYKITYILLSLFALYTLIFNAPNTKASIRGLLMIPALILASAVSVLFSSNISEELVRMTFFGLPFFYALLFVLISSIGTKTNIKIGYTLAILLIFTNFVRIAYAQKVWKFGWDAETKLAERIITRLEKMPEFNIDRQYQLIQIGEKGLREKYYQKQLKEQPSAELLNGAYYPKGASKDAYNFFYQTDFLESDAKAEALQNPAIRDYLINKARAWPAKESLFIYGNYIVIVLDEKDLALTQRQLYK